MKRFLTTTVAAAALLCGVSSAAHATYTCGVPTQFLGKTGTNPVVSTTLTRDGVNWSVVHTLRDGTLIDRSTQYNIVDASTGNVTTWSGRSTKHPSLWMDGVLKNGVYTEVLHDNARGGGVVMRSEASCARIDASAPVAAPTPSYSPEPDVKTIVPADPKLEVKRGRADCRRWAASLCAGHCWRLCAHMLIDTGASESSITAFVADQLIATNQATDGPSEQFKLADGSIKSERSVVVHTLTIGGHVLHNIRVGVVDNNGMMLLGFDVLNQVSSKFAVDTANSTLDFD